MVDVGGHIPDGAAQLGGIVGDEVEILAEAFPQFRREDAVLGCVIDDGFDTWDGFFGGVVLRFHAACFRVA